jgi:hypothetical protein
MTSRMFAVMPISRPAWRCEICLQFKPARSLQDRAEPYLRHRQVSVHWAAIAQVNISRAMYPLWIGGLSGNSGVRNAVAVAGDLNST